MTGSGSVLAAASALALLVGPGPARAETPGRTSGPSSQTAGLRPPTLEQACANDILVLRLDEAGIPPEPGAEVPREPRAVAPGERRGGERAPSSSAPGPEGVGSRLGEMAQLFGGHLAAGRGPDDTVTLTWRPEPGGTRQDCFQAMARVARRYPAARLRVATTEPQALTQAERRMDSLFPAEMREAPGEASFWSFFDRGRWGSRLADTDTGVVARYERDGWTPSPDFSAAGPRAEMPASFRQPIGSPPSPGVSAPSSSFGERVSNAYRGARDYVADTYNRGSAAVGRAARAVGQYVGSFLPRFAAGLSGYRSDAYRFGTPQLVEGLRWMGERFSAMGMTMNVGDLSKRGGGDIPGHASHEKGVDADIRLFPSMSQNWQWVQMATSNPHFSPTMIFLDQSKINEVLGYARRSGQDPAAIQKARGVLRHWPNHSDHFHLRIA